ncbi:hypothetical protein [Vibrio barjaei]|uniref:hypothetical protein n=1 Tax=Vibrio barjaei TaxID=1676683 RepID=UPI0022848EB9|nr:hypothetical protein [Vibrio barjaei]MCY9872997.1 hypothetical protein [Vibrio barjaei]
MTVTKMLPIMREIWHSSQWRWYQLSVILCVSTMSFAVMVLKDTFEAETEVFLMMAGVYGLNYILLCTKVVRDKLLEFSFVGVLLAGALFILGYPIMGAFVYFAAFAQCVRDVLNVGMLKEYTRISKKIQVEERVVIATSMFIGPLIIAVALVGIGLLLTYSAHAFFALVWVATFFTVFMSKSSQADAKSLEPKTEKFSQLLILGGMCFCGGVYAFFVRYMLVPLFILNLGEILDVGRGSFVILGLFASLMLLIGLLKRKSNRAKKSELRFMTLFHFCLSTTLVVPMLFLAFNLDTFESWWWMASLFVALYLAFDLFNKNWTVNYIALLNDVGTFYGMKRRGMDMMMKAKALGGCVGFLLPAVLYNYLSPMWFMSAFCLCNVIIMPFVWRYCLEDITLSEGLELIPVNGERVWFSR